MRFSPYCLVAIFALLAACHNEPSITGWDYTDLHGKVKRTTVNVSVAMLKGNKWTKLGGNNRYEVRTADYDPQGNLVKEETYTKDSLKERVVYTYKENKVDSIITYNGAGALQYFRVVAAAEPVFKIQRWQLFVADSLKVTETVSWQGARLSEKKGDSRSGSKTVITYTRNENGDVLKMVSEITSPASAPFSYQENYVYSTLDKQKNWTLRFNIYDGTSRFGSAEERTIEYY